MSIIKQPQRYLALDLKEGSNAVVHFLPMKKKLIGIQLELDPKLNILNPKISLENIGVTERKKVELFVEKIIDKVITKGNIYTLYSYLFLYKRGKFYLLSVSYNNYSLAYSTVVEIAKELGLNYLLPQWKGIYTKQKLFSFIEDIFVQKL
jgi:hypothetical protein